MSWGDNLAAIETAHKAGQMIGEAEAKARHYKNAAEKWKAHAEQMKADLEKVWEMYIDRVGSEQAQTKLKTEALSEIEKLDPLNKMLNTGYRQKLYDETYNETTRKMREKQN